jgi:hypothetical protein
VRKRWACLIIAPTGRQVKPGWMRVSAANAGRHQGTKLTPTGGRPVHPGPENEEGAALPGAGWGAEGRTAPNHGTSAVPWPGSLNCSLEAQFPANPRGDRGRYSIMELKGISYRVVQTANPTGWRWTIELPGKAPKSGQATSRARAVRMAETAIDKAIKVKRQPKRTIQ